MTVLPAAPAQTTLPPPPAGFAGRLVALDLLRALAVFLVVGHHAAQRFAPGRSDPAGEILDSAGWIGVDIFFVISGFMIARILMRDAHDIAGFFRRRMFRILPLHLVAVAIFALSALALGWNVAQLDLIWSPALLLNGWTLPFYGYGRVPFTITWSLSVEETAYLLLGTAMLAGPRGLRTALLAFLAIALATRWACVATGFFKLEELYFFVPARLDSIALGGLAALGTFDRLLRHRLAVPLALLVTCGLIAAFSRTDIADPLLPVAGYFVFAGAVAALVGGLAVRAESGAEDGLAPSAWLHRIAIEYGQLSYFIYLFHIFVLEGIGMLQNAFPGHRLSFWEAMALTNLVVFALARVSWRWFEAPLIRHSRRPRRRALALPAPEGSV